MLELFLMTMFNSYKWQGENVGELREVELAFHIVVGIEKQLTERFFFTFGIPLIVSWKKTEDWEGEGDGIIVYVREGFWVFPTLIELGFNFR